MLKKQIIFLLLLSVVVCVEADRPNLVIILADDLGWMDINPTAEYATGTPAEKQFYETPHLNALAKDGVAFSRCYSMPLCTPSRATIVTGRNGATFGFNNAAGMRGGKFTYAANGKTPPGDYLLHDELPGTAPGFPVATATGNYALPNGLPDSKGQKVYSLAEMLPDYRSAFLGKWHIGGNDIEGHRPQDFGFEAIAYEDEGWSSYKKNARKNWHFPGPPAQKDYLTDDLTALSVDWIRNHVDENPKQPFLLYLAHFGVHDPFEARPEDVAYFETKKTRGWNGHDNPTYAGMIRAVDDSVGTIRAALKKLGIADNTIIVFTSDNGAQVQKKGVNVTSNAPLRGQKAQTFEGGIRVPMIICPAGNKGNGAWVDTPVTLEDVAPTLAALGRQEVPEQIREQWTGQSLVPLLQRRPADFAKRAIFIHEPYYRPDHLTEGSPMLTPSSVMIEGDYYLIAYHDGVLRLYDLSSDIGETNDLSAAMPERVSNMKKRIMQWRVKNVPDRYDTSANPRYSPQADQALPAPDGPLFVR
jgi:arylsulfatase A-like enzyme